MAKYGNEYRYCLSNDINITLINNSCLHLIPTVIIKK